VLPCGAGRSPFSRCSLASLLHSKRSLEALLSLPDARREAWSAHFASICPTLGTNLPRFCLWCVFTGGACALIAHIRLTTTGRSRRPNNALSAQAAFTAALLSDIVLDHASTTDREQPADLIVRIRPSTVTRNDGPIDHARHPPGRPAAGVVRQVFDPTTKMPSVRRFANLKIISIVRRAIGRLSTARETKPMRGLPRRGICSCTIALQRMCR
jgi:hypothetical protein